MLVLELNRKENLGEADFPLVSLHAKVAMTLDVAPVNVPAAAVRRMALEWLRRIASEAEEEDFLSTASHEVADDSAGVRPRGDWVQPPDLDLRVVKSAHRIVLEIAKRGESGRAVLAAELAGEVGLSPPTIGRLLRNGEPANDYLKQFVLITPSGRTKALDLTPAGRLLASKIRAGAAPV